jgi:hypothetical protein
MSCGKKISCTNSDLNVILSNSARSNSQTNWRAFIRVEHDTEKKSIRSETTSRLPFHGKINRSRLRSKVDLDKLARLKNQNATDYSRLPPFRSASTWRLKIRTTARRPSMTQLQLRNSKSISRTHEDHHQKPCCPIDQWLAWRHQPQFASWSTLGSDTKMMKIVCPIFHDAPPDLIDLPITWAEHATWRLGNANSASNSTMNNEPHAESTRQQLDNPWQIQGPSHTQDYSWQFKNSLVFIDR